jgi:hypothetical protein
MALTTIDDAQHEVWAMEQDAIADHGDEVEISGQDLVVSVCFNIEDDDLARELCRVELGHVPFELEARLGKKDWIDS